MQEKSRERERAARDENKERERVGKRHVHVRGQPAYWSVRANSWSLGSLRDRLSPPLVATLVLLRSFRMHGPESSGGTTRPLFKILIDTQWHFLVVSIPNTCRRGNSFENRNISGIYDSDHHFEKYVNSTLITISLFLYNLQGLQPIFPRFTTLRQFWFRFSEWEIINGVITRPADVKGSWKSW